LTQVLSQTMSVPAQLVEHSPPTHASPSSQVTPMSLEEPPPMPFKEEQSVAPQYW
jgi:hypothetical protein